MNIFGRITWKTMKRNRARTIVTIIGVILSTAMITAVTVMVGSAQSYAIDIAKQQYGDWHGMVQNASEQQVRQLTEDSRVTERYLAKQLGYAPAGETVGKPYIYLLAVDDGFRAHLPIHLTEGRFPEAKTEILLPEHLVYSSQEAYQLGQTITIRLGQREGNLNQNNPYQEGETLMQLEPSSFVITGFYQPPSFEEYDAPGYTALTALADQKADGYEVYYKVQNLKEAFNFAEELGLGGAVNTNLLAYSGAFRYDNLYVTLYGLAVFLILLILTGSVALIDNAFAISVTERTSQFGLLSSIGATWRQLRGSVLFEALLIAAIGIPLGILCGIFGIDVTLRCVEAALMNALSTDLPMRLTVTWSAVGLAAAIALVTVFISAWLPARRAKKITAMEAIRKNRDVRIRNRERGGGRWTLRLFGVEGLLACRYFARSRKKYRITIFSLALSMVLFVVSGSVQRYLVGDLEDSILTNQADIQLDIYDEGTAPQAEQLRQLEGVTTVTYAQVTYCETNQGPVALWFLEDDRYREWIRQEGIDLETDGDAGIIYDRQMIRTEGQFEWRQQLPENIRGITLTETGRQLQIGARIERLPAGVEEVDRPLILYPYSARNEISAPEEQSRLRYGIMTNEEHQKALTQVTRWIRQQKAEDYTISDQKENQRSGVSAVTIIKVFSYGFIVLISLIAAANVFNTISTNITLRRKEFAVLQSLGFSKRSVWRMLSEESFIYGWKALLWGIPVSLTLSFAAQRFLQETFAASWRFPATEIVIGTIGILVVVLAAMAYSGAKMRKDNPLEALKGED